MPWTYPQLKAAYLALSPAPASDGAAAAILNAQTTTLPPQDIDARSALAIFLLSGEWPNIVLRSRMVPSGASPATTADTAIKAAIAAVQLTQSIGTIGTSSMQAWTVLSNSMQALLAAGDISQASIDNITALRTPTLPTWQPALSTADVTAARTLY